MASHTITLSATEEATLLEALRIKAIVASSADEAILGIVRTALGRTGQRLKTAVQDATYKAYVASNTGDTKAQIDARIVVPPLPVEDS